VPLRHPPRHLAMSQRSGMDARQHDVAEWILAAVAIVLTAVVLVSSMFSHPNSRPGPPATDRPAAAPSTTPAPTSTVAARPPTSGPASLVRVGFEADLAGWRPIGAARIKRDPRAHQGRWAARFTGSGIADQGMALPAALQAGQGLCRQCLGAGRPASHAGRGEPAGSCGGRRYATDTVGDVLESGDWQRIEVAHLGHRPGATLAFEVVLPRGPRRPASWSMSWR
jgi:hypothetical protein